MTGRAVTLALAQLLSPVPGLYLFGCWSCAGLFPLALVPIATAEVPWLALVAQTRAASEPRDAVAGLAYLGFTFALASLSAWWLVRGRRAVGALVLAGWIGWWSVAVLTAEAVHEGRTHESRWR